jgi:anti-sigma factor (TIGR02949 family)
MRLACVRMRRLMTERADGRLSAAGRRRLESHIEACPECRKEYEGLREVRALLASAPRFSAPAGLTARVMRDLYSKRLEERRAFLPGLVFMRTMEAAVILVVIAAGIMSGNFVATGLFPQARDTGVAASAAGRSSALLAYSIDAFDPAPPETVGAAFVTEDMNEK